MPATRFRCFPADVTLPGGTELRTVLVLDRGEGVHVYARRSDYPGEDTRDERVVLVGTFGTEVVPQQLDRWTIATDEGEVLVTRGSGCGCSHPLKGWGP